ncbi:YlmH family RNA-binding protein [Paenibacillus xylaniclasticus]|uniref:YlmH family RNA-binding protein n=1 Tax=Paenibacillus xylaniclasticus TaxID=588083 RepID=UPI000FD9E5E9|nr:MULTISPECIES: YlmH/Sll1252 family protein [Paenibacillus]GFN30415.1 RNA-binding protein S4 [Paenibacillus curdlanolyticus]
MFSNKKIYEHFHPDERAFVDRVEEWIERAAERHEWKRTDFMDPRQLEIVRSLANRSGNVALRCDGGSPDAERQRVLIAPDYAYLDDEPMGVQAVAVTADSQGHLELDHGDYLGALLGLGVKRELIGDIHVLEDGCHCLVTEEIADYINIHLRQVHRVHVLTELIPLSSLRITKPKLEEMSLSVASLRLDGIASDVYRISRTKIVEPIRAGRCRVNWKVEENPSAVLKAGDIVSMKGLGRFKVIDVEGVTKKGRIRVSIGKFI